MCYIIMYLKLLSVYILIQREMGKMGTIICQTCKNTIESFEDEKVTVLYSKCKGCHSKK